ncbi:MAG: hypothetical protein J7J07_07460 [Syntrophobacterales bacterium]|nr:hypothetical protein [Syntrophobacterales bacterium]
MTNTRSTEDEIDGTKPDHTPVANADNDGLRWKIAKALGLKYYKWADRWGNSDDQAGTYLGDDVGKFWGQNGQAWIPITMAVVYNWAADILENGGYITYYGSASSSADDASVDDYSALYVHSGTGGRANSDVPIPEMMSWLKEIDNFFVNSKDDDAKTVTDPIKHYSDDEYEDQLFGTCTFGEGGATYTQKATIASNTSDTLTFQDGVDMGSINAGDENSMYFIYSDDPIRTNFVLKDFAKYRDHITTNALTKTFVTLSNLKAIRQDIEIIEFNFFSTFDQGPVDDSVFQAANEVKKARLDDLVKHIGGVQDSAGTPITPAQKEALVLMFVQPDF